MTVFLGLTQGPLSMSKARSDSAGGGGTNLSRVLPDDRTLPRGVDGTINHNPNRQRAVQRNRQTGLSLPLLRVHGAV